MFSKRHPTHCSIALCCKAYKPYGALPGLPAFLDASRRCNESIARARDPIVMHVTTLLHYTFAQLVLLHAAIHTATRLRRTRKNRDACSRAAWSTLRCAIESATGRPAGTCTPSATPTCPYMFTTTTHSVNGALLALLDVVSNNTLLWSKAAAFHLQAGNARRCRLHILLRAQGTKKTRARGAGTGTAACAQLAKTISIRWKFTVGVWVWWAGFGGQDQRLCKERKG